MGHTRLIERIEKAAIAARIAGRIAPLQDGERNLSARPRRASSFWDIFAFDCAQEIQAGGPTAAPAEIAAFESRLQVRILVGEHRELAGCGMADEENVDG